MPAGVSTRSKSSSGMPRSARARCISTRRRSGCGPRLIGSAGPPAAASPRTWAGDRGAGRGAGSLGGRGPAGSRAEQGHLGDVILRPPGALGLHRDQPAVAARRREAVGDTGPASPSRRRSHTVLRGHVSALAGLSESLRIHRSDHGLLIHELGRHDVEMFLQRLAYLEQCDEISALSRSLICRKVHHALSRLRLLGLARAGSPLSGLPDDFALRREDVPRRPDRQVPNRGLPAEILAQLCDALPLLRTRASTVLAVAIELLIDTGRRPSEILNLAWGCLDRDHDDNYVLVYDDLKNNRPGRRLPITQATAELVTVQQHATREPFPAVNPTDLALLPAARPHAADRPHADGRRAMARHLIGRAHRDWLRRCRPRCGVPTARPTT